MNVIRLAATAAIVSSFVGAIAAAQAPAPAPEGSMRMPWLRGSIDYIRSWKVTGVHPCDLARDCLDIPGGEAAARADVDQKRADGSALAWTPQTSWGDFIALHALPDRKDGTVAYAFATVQRAAAGPARLSIGSTDGVRVFLNGKRVLSRDGHRSLTPDEDQVDVQWMQGANALLIKMEASGTFTARVLAPGAELRRSAEIGPSVIEVQPNVFTVRTDVSDARAAAEPVKVELVAPGGEVKFSGTARRGELLSVPAAELADGPYEVRASTRTAAGLLYVTHLPFFKGNALPIARELRAEAGKADARTPEGAQLQMLAAMVEDRLGGQPDTASGNPWPKIHSPLLEYRELLLERQGRTGGARPGGFVRLAWVDEVDGSVQYARAYLPAGYDPAKKWPLVLNLHGFNPPNPVYVRWWSVDSRHPSIDTEFASHEQVILVEPHGRGNTQYVGLGDRDVLRALDEARRRFGVDDDRVYLTGESMGGFGTWNVGTRHPDRFAALAPVFGGIDYHSYLSPERLSALTPAERFIHERGSSFALAENLLHVPVFVHHGDADEVVKVEWSRWGVKLLQRFGYDVRYQEYPGRIHETLRTGTSDPNMSIQWFLGHRRQTDPRTVRIRSPELRNASAYWVRIEQAASPRAFMEVDAEILDRHLIRLDTDNVLAIALTPGTTLVDAARPVRVVWNGVARETPWTDGALRLASPGYLPASGSSSGPAPKSASLPGGINDFFNTPFAVVIGTTSKDPALRKLCEEKAQALIGLWRDWQKQEPRVFRDVEIGDVDLARYSLLLFGGPDENRVAARLAAGLPLRLSRDAIAVDGHPFRARDAAVQLVYPNPRNAGRYVWLVAANSAAGMSLAEVSPFSLTDWDYVITDGHMPAFKQAAWDTQTRVVSGSFDHAWRYSAALAVEGDPAVRARANRVRAAPAALDPKQADDLVGRYRTTNGLDVQVMRDGGRLVARSSGTDADMLPQGGASFYLPTFKVWVEFVRDASGRITGFQGAGGGDDIEAARLP